MSEHHWPLASTAYVNVVTGEHRHTFRTAI